MKQRLNEATSQKSPSHDSIQRGTVCPEAPPLASKHFTSASPRHTHTHSPPPHTHACTHRSAHHSMPPWPRPAPTPSGQDYCSAPPQTMWGSPGSLYPLIVCQVPTPLNPPNRAGIQHLLTVDLLQEQLPCKTVFQTEQRKEREKVKPKNCRSAERGRGRKI